MEIKEAQELYNKYLGEINHPKVGAYIALVEEVGELAQEILNREIYDYIDKNDNISKELTDVFICILEICDIYKINLEDAYLDKMRLLRKKAENEWKAGLAKTLKEKRDKMD